LSWARYWRWRTRSNIVSFEAGTSDRMARFGSAPLTQGRIIRPLANPRQR
jgi:hypothetical protein